MSGDGRLVAVLRRMQIPAYRQRFLEVLDLERRQESVEEHLMVIDAILAGDADKAEDLMRLHVRRSGELAQFIAGLRPSIVRGWAVAAGKRYFFHSPAVRQSWGPATLWPKAFRPPQILRRPPNVSATSRLQRRSSLNERTEGCSDSENKSQVWL